MKKAFLSLLFVFICISGAFCQEELSGSYLDYNDMSSGWVVSVFEDTIFDIFKKDLSSYNTDLKKEVFLSSPDSQKYKDNLEKIKKHLKTEGITYVSRSNMDDWSIKNYDTKTKSFRVTFGSNLSMGGTSGIGMKNVIAGFYAPQVPISTNVIEVFKEMYGTSDYVTYDYNWKVDDINKALEIEDSLKDVGIRLKVIVSGISVVKAKGYANNSWYDISGKRATAKKIVIEFYNKKTNKIYDSIEY